MREIEIPEGYEAKIENNKVIFVPKESEDERIRKNCIHFLELQKAHHADTSEIDDCIAYLEKQKAKEKYDRMAPIYKDKDSFEDALDKAWKFYNDSGSSTVDGCEDNAVELAFAKGFREGFLAEKQKEQKPAECLNPERDCWYVCIKDFYAGGKKQSSKGDLVQAKGGMYMMGREDISEWFRKAYYDEIKPAEWSEEDKDYYDAIIAKLEVTQDDAMLTDNQIDFLKSLTERFYLQPKQEWNEEDEQDFEQYCKILDEMSVTYQSLGHGENAMYLRRIREFIKFLWSQKNWKPSEEQMAALNEASVSWMNEKMGNSELLKSLYNDLKKL